MDARPCNRIPGGQQARRTPNAPSPDSPRHLTTRTGRLMTKTETGLCRLCWISSDAVEFVTCVSLQAGESVHLKLAESAILEGVIFEAGDARGTIHLLRPIDPLAMLRGLRQLQCGGVERSARLPTSIDAIATCGGAQHCVRVRDVSEHGMCLEHDGVLSAGDLVQVVLPDRIVKGNVKWSTGHRAGLQFDVPSQTS